MGAPAGLPSVISAASPSRRRSAPRAGPGEGGAARAAAATCRASLAPANAARRATKRPNPNSDRADHGEIGTAYLIRTGDLRLERAVSWASRRMRRDPSRPREAEPAGMVTSVPPRWQPPADSSGASRGGWFRGRCGSTQRPAGSPARPGRGRSASGPRRARSRRRATRRGAPSFPLVRSDQGPRR